MMVLLAQEWDSPLIKYFSFIVLGLMMTIGYVVLRFITSKKKVDDGSRSRTESLLAEAEREARQMRQARQGQSAGPQIAASAPQALELSPEQQAEQEKLKSLVQQHEDAEKSSPEAPAASDEEPDERGIQS